MNEIRVTYQGANTPYAVIQDNKTGYAWNGTSLEAWNDTNLADYVITLSSIGGDNYVGDIPTLLPPGRYNILVYAQVGQSPLTTDLVLGTMIKDWDGTLFSVIGDSYASLSDGSDYMAGYMKSDPWDNATDAQKTKALITATRMIDRLNIYGRPLVAMQPLQFPRHGTLVVPEDIKVATILLANTLLDGVDPELEFENLNLSTQKYSSISSTYDRSIPPEHIVAGIVSIEAWRYLKPYLRNSYTVDLSRVS